MYSAIYIPRLILKDVSVLQTFASALEVFYENALYKFTFDIDIDIDICDYWLATGTVLSSLSKVLPYKFPRITYD